MNMSNFWTVLHTIAAIALLFSDFEDKTSWCITIFFSWLILMTLSSCIDAVFECFRK